MAEVTVQDIETLLNPLGKKLDLISNRVDWGTTGDNTVGKATEKLKTLTDKLGALLNVQINAVKNDAANAKAPDQALAPLNQIAAKLELIYGFITEKLNTLTYKLGALLNVQVNAVKNDAAFVKAPDQALAPLNQIADKLELIYSCIKETLTEKLDTLTYKLNALLNVQVNAVKNDAANAKAPGQELAPLNQIAAKLELIYGFIKETFKPTGLGSEDDNKGMLDRPEKEKGKKSKGSAWLGGTLVAATLMSIKDYLEETWTGLAQRFLKPFVAVQLAIKGLPKSLSGLSLNFQRFTSKLAAKFPRLSKVMTNLMKPIRWVTTKVNGFGRAISNAVKNFKISKIFAPLLTWVSKLGGVAGLGGFFGFLSPLLPLLKAFALPLTLALEAFEAFNMIFVGSFSKNAEKLADDISKKGVLGRMWYGFTHMFQTIAASVKTQFDTITQTFDILFSDHPDGIVGKLKNVGEIILTPIKTMFEDFIIYPIQKALAFLPDWMIKVDDPDDAEKGSENNVDEGTKSKRLDTARQDIKDKAAKYGTTEKEYEAYLKYRDAARSSAAKTGKSVQTFEDWRDKPKKMNESSALPKPNTTGPYQGAGSPHGQALLQQKVETFNTTFEVKLPSPGEIINQSK